MNRKKPKRDMIVRISLPEKYHEWLEQYLKARGVKKGFFVSRAVEAMICRMSSGDPSVMEPCDHEHDVRDN